MSSAGLEPVCLHAAVLELVYTCCRSRAVVSAADLELVIPVAGPEQLCLLHI